MEKLFSKVVRSLKKIFDTIPQNNAQMVVKSSITNRLVCSFAIAALKMSPQYEQFKKEKIWLLNSAELQKKMQEAKF